MKKRLIASLLTILTFQCSIFNVLGAIFNVESSVLSTQSFSAFAQSENIRVGSTQRNMITYVPQKLPYGAPLLISLHGMNQDAAYQQNQTQWNLVADTAKFVVVYPNGNNKSWDISGDSDIKFLEVIIDSMYNRHHIDRNRVYVSGFSMGGMMTYHCMANMADKVAAFAPVSGIPMDQRAPQGKRKVPFIHTHGTADDVVQWSPILGYVKRWVAFNGLDPDQDHITKPYPKTKANSTTTKHHWYSDEDTVEVVLMELAGKGHWHSCDLAGGTHSSIEIWNFCKRYALGPQEAEPASVTKVEPEDGAFDMTAENNQFTLTFSKPIDVEQVKATLGDYTLTTTGTGYQETVCFSLPENTTPGDGDYTLTVTNAISEDGGKLRKATYNYTYGIEEVGLTMKVDTLFFPRWEDEQVTLGEGIPAGWKRTNTLSDGNKESVLGEIANTAGVRMKYFTPGGDFDAGFYFSAREFQQCELIYGTKSPYLLTLKQGKYDLRVNSAYWNSSAKQGGTTFDVSVNRRTTDTKVFSKSNLSSAFCLDENTNQQVIGSEEHTFTFDISTDTNYTLNFTTAGGWTGLILGNILLTTHASNADVYKGGFLREMNAAQTLYDKSANKPTARKSLKTVMDKYADLKSILPSVYQSATDELAAAMLALEKASVEEADTSEADPNFHIYLCFGQSNMEGNAQPEDVDYEGVSSRFKVLAACNGNYHGKQRVANRWYTATPPLCRSYTGLTPADYFGRLLCDSLPEEISVGVVMVALGGASIDTFDEDKYQTVYDNAVSWFKGYMDEYGGNPYARMVELAREAQKKGVIKGILLHQGETDNGQQDWPQRVKKIYDRLIDDLNLDPTEVPLLAGEMRYENKGGICYGHNAIIAKLPRTIPNSYVISASNIEGTSADGFHFSAKGYRDLGKRYARKMWKLLKPTLTGIKDVSSDSAPTAGWFTLAGQKLNDAPTSRGVYIHDGKKIIVSGQ